VDEANREERFGLIYQANYPRILGYVLRRVQQPQDAADVVAETFLIAWRRLDVLPSDPDEAPLWLYGVARRVLANHRRGERRRSRLGDRLREEIWELLEASEPAARGEFEVVVPALGQLREQDREILGLVAWEGLSHEELRE
jgi:RNA polymerase sigma factor (sigma-70 family)